jgi:hypothetical protein
MQKHHIIGGAIIASGVLLLATWIIVFCIPLVMHYPLRYEYGACYEVVSKECDQWERSQIKKITVFKYLTIYFSPEARSERRFDKMLDESPSVPSVDLNHVVLPNGQDVKSYQCEHDREWLEEQLPEEAAKCPH